MHGYSYKEDNSYKARVKKAGFHNHMQMNTLVIRARLY